MNASVSTVIKTNALRISCKDSDHLMICFDGSNLKLEGKYMFFLVSNLYSAYNICLNRNFKIISKIIFGSHVITRRNNKFFT